MTIECRRCGNNFVQFQYDPALKYTPICIACYTELLEDDGLEMHRKFRTNPLNDGGVPADDVLAERNG